MRIHKDTYHAIVQSVINEYDERIKTTIEVIAPMNYFRSNMYANVMDITKDLMYKREYIYDRYDYPVHTMSYITGVHNKIIKRLCDYTYDKCYAYRSNKVDCETEVKTMFDVSEPLEDQHGITRNGIFIPATFVIGKFHYPKINKKREDYTWKEQAMSDAIDALEEDEDRGNIDIPYLGLPDDEQDIGHWNLD
ncbi:hypothetical protein [Winogradskyella vidalii]|uniref:hypothetical protein n=1 Tax=Winogradskyella vidalii TaxID=2615024 RepID=UPI0015CC3480|nr:hypothetical protein [Winogradskyella vidalii]